MEPEGGEAAGGGGEAGAREELIGVGGLGLEACIGNGVLDGGGSGGVGWGEGCEGGGFCVSWGNGGGEFLC